MRIRQLFQLISGLTAAIMLGVVLLIFVCPMTGAMPMTGSVGSATVMCVDTGMANNFGAMGACVDLHLANAHKFISNLFSPVAVWVGFAVLAFGLAVGLNIFKNLLLKFARVTAVRLRQRLRLFYHSIRQKFQKTLLAYLADLENSANASLV